MGWILVGGVLLVAVVALVAAGGWIAWKAGNKLQQAPIASSQKSATAGTRYGDIDRLLMEVRQKVDKDVDDPELTAGLGRHLDDLEARKEAAMDRLSELDDLLESGGMRPETRDAKMKEKASLEEGLGKIVEGLVEIKAKLTHAPDSAAVTDGIAGSLASLNGELDSQEKARREIAALEKKA